MEFWWRIMKKMESYLITLFLLGAEPLQKNKIAKDTVQRRNRNELKDENKLCGLALSLLRCPACHFASKVCPFSIFFFCYYLFLFVFNFLHLFLNVFFWFSLKWSISSAHVTCQLLPLSSSSSNVLRLSGQQRCAGYSLGQSAITICTETIELEIFHWLEITG